MGDQVPLGADGKRREEAQELQPFAVLETGGRICQVPKWNNLAVCILPTLTATTADTAQGRDSDWRKREGRAERAPGITSYFRTQMKREHQFPAMHSMEVMSGHSWNEGRRCRSREDSRPCSRVWGSCRSPESQKNGERKKRSSARFGLAVVQGSSSTRNKHRQHLGVCAQVWALQVQLRASSHQPCLEQPGQFLGEQREMGGGAEHRPSTGDTEAACPWAGFVEHFQAA